MNNPSFSAQPRLGFAEAVKKVLNNVINFKGRSRRSEYWWYILAACIVNFIASLIFGSLSTVYSIITTLVSLSTIAVAVRRVQDSGHSPIWVYLEFISSIILMIYMSASGYYDIVNSANPNPNEIVSIILNPLFWIPCLVAVITGLVAFVFCLFDSDPMANKYGESPKYTFEEDTVKE